MLTEILHGAMGSTGPEGHLAGLGSKPSKTVIFKTDD